MNSLAKPNSISQDYKDFYISYNAGDYMVYGAVTTALVIGQMEIVYILEGDHRKEYQEIGENLDKCIEYFARNSDKMANYSDEIGKPTAAELVREHMKKSG